MSDDQRSFLRATGVMSVGTALSRLTGFGRLAAAAFALGITETRLADAYNIANITPNIVYELALGGILTSVVVPVVVEWLRGQGAEEAREVGRRLLSIAVVVLGGVAVVGIVAAPWIVRLVTLRVGEGREEVVELATFFLRWFMPQILFYGIGAIAGGMLTAERRFAAPMFAPILNNLVVIATFLAYAAMPGPAPGSGMLATDAQRLVLALGTTLGVVAMSVAVWPALRGTGFRFAWRLRGASSHPAIRRIGGLATWVLAYVATNQVGYAVVLVLAAGQQGGYTAYAAAFMLFQLPHAIFAVSIFTALLPGMAERWTAGDQAGFRRLLERGLRATAAIVLPASLGYLVLARPIVRLLLEHGVTGVQSGDLVARVLVAFSLGLVPFSAFQLLLRASYATQDTRTPALINVVAVAVNLAINLWLYLSTDLGVVGLALGHAASYLVGSVLLLARLRRRIGQLDGAAVAAGAGRAAMAAVATAAVAWATAAVVGDAVDLATLGGQAAQVGGAVVLGVATYLGAAMLLGVEEVRAVGALVRGRSR